MSHSDELVSELASIPDLPGARLEFVFEDMTR